jgi:hypothetical protein
MGVLVVEFVWVGEGAALEAAAAALARERCLPEQVVITFRKRMWTLGREARQGRAQQRRLFGGNAGHPAQPTAWCRGVAGAPSPRPAASSPPFLARSAPQDVRVCQQHGGVAIRDPVVSQPAHKKKQKAAAGRGWDRMQAGIAPSVRSSACDKGTQLHPLPHLNTFSSTPWRAASTPSQPMNTHVASASPCGSGRQLAAMWSLPRPESKGNGAGCWAGSSGDRPVILHWLAAECFEGAGRELGVRDSTAACVRALTGSPLRRGGGLPASPGAPAGSAARRQQRVPQRPASPPQRPAQATQHPCQPTNSP